MHHKRPGFLLWKLLFLMVILVLVIFFARLWQHGGAWSQFIQPETGTFGSD